MLIFFLKKKKVLEKRKFLFSNILLNYHIILLKNQSEKKNIFEILK